MLYLNNTPIQPRERDYAYAGATYAFAIWIGLGVLMVYKLFEKSVKGAPGVFLTAVICLAAVPALMAKEEWNDHDRSKKTLARASAWNTLQSCEKNGILFTFGDNDTYPLWYLQEVEGIRTDVRVINLSLLGIDWYISQLEYKVNDADAVPMVWSNEKYAGDKRNYVLYNDLQGGKSQDTRFYPLVDVLNFVNSDDRKDMAALQSGDFINYYPTKNYVVNSLSKEQLIQSGMVKAADSAKIINDMRFVFNKNGATKSDLAVLNIVGAIARDGWKRPIYFSGGLGQDNYQGMGDYLKLEGIVYRLVPYKYIPGTVPTEQGAMGFVDADKSYDLFTKTYQWGGAERNDVYFDEKNKIMLVAYRNNAPRIAATLAFEGKKDKAVALLNHVTKNITQSALPANPEVIAGGFEMSAIFLTDGYYRAGSVDSARKTANRLLYNLKGDLEWMMTLKDSRKETMGPYAMNTLRNISYIYGIAEQARDTVYSKQLEQELMSLQQKVMASGIPLQNPGEGR